jgi:hypothetical protein
MKFLSCDTFHLTFKAICVLTATFLVLYWFAQFMKNEDVSIIRYEPLEDMEEVVHPEFSICFYLPILDVKLREVGGNVSLEEYAKYLYGISNATDNYRHIGFNDVTLDLFEHLAGVQIFWRSTNATNCTDNENCPFVRMKNNFNGLWFKQIYKCFGVEVQKEYAKEVKSIVVIFKPSLRNALSQIQTSALTETSTFVTFNYPQQILKFSEAIQYIWPTGVSDKNMDGFIITSIEVLKRRNKHNERCLEDWKHFDDLVLNKHLKTVGCSAPYQKTHLPICTSQEKIHEAQYEASQVRKKYHPEPCQEISNIIYNFNRMPVISNESVFILIVVYPDKIKLVTQRQSVDVQVLIGNIGGYIGLFLGKGLISL